MSLTPREAERLLGGYATGTLSPEELNALMAAALHHQSVFDALADEDVLRQLLTDPQAKAQLLAALSLPMAPRVVPLWRRPALMGAAAGLLLSVLTGLAYWRSGEPARMRQEFQATPALKAPATAPEAAAPPAADKAAAEPTPTHSPDLERHRQDRRGMNDAEPNPSALQEQAPATWNAGGALVPQPAPAPTPAPARGAAAPPSESKSEAATATAFTREEIAPTAAKRAKKWLAKEKSDAAGKVADTAQAQIDPMGYSKAVVTTVELPHWSLERLTPHQARLSVRWKGPERLVIARQHEGKSEVLAPRSTSFKDGEQEAIYLFGLDEGDLLDLHLYSAETSTQADTLAPLLTKRLHPSK